MIDIYATKNLQEFVFELGKGIMNGLKPRGRKAWDLFLSCLSSLRAGISFDFAGNPGWNLEMGDIKTPSITLDEIFYYLEKADKPCLVVAVTNSPKHDFNRYKSVTCKFLSRDTKSARDKNGTKPRKNKVKNTSSEISLVEYLCFVCKGTNLSLEKRGKIPISLIHNSFSYHCTPNVVIANGFDLKRLGLRKLGVKFCFALCWTFSKMRTGNRTLSLIHI